MAIDAGTKKCTDLSAPGLVERFPSMPVNAQQPQRGAKRPGAEIQQPPVPSAKAKIQNQKRQAAKKRLQEENKKLANQLKQANQRAQSQGRKGGGRGNPKGGGRGDGGAGAKGAGKGGLPAGAKKKTAGDQFICFNWNQGIPCKATPCPWAHVCWFCEDGGHAGGMSKTC